jgi:SAM-dependent methyltransferase
VSEPILDPLYWKRRLQAAQQTSLHHAVFRCPLDRWARIEAKHAEVLRVTIGKEESVLDVGCGWGRLLNLCSGWWRGEYLGVDLSPDFIELGKTYWKNRKRTQFVCGAVPDVTLHTHHAFDWSVCVSIRPMVRRNLGECAWTSVATWLRSVSVKTLYLEYDEADPGSVEC